MRLPGSNPPDNAALSHLFGSEILIDHGFDAILRFRWWPQSFVASIPVESLRSVPEL